MVFGWGKNTEKPVETGTVWGMKSKDYVDYTNFSFLSWRAGIVDWNVKRKSASESHIPRGSSKSFLTFGENRLPQNSKTVAISVEIRTSSIPGFFKKPWDGGCPRWAGSLLSRGNGPQCKKMHGTLKRSITLSCYTFDWFSLDRNVKLIKPLAQYPIFVYKLRKEVWRSLNFLDLLN